MYSHGLPSNSIAAKSSRGAYISSDYQDAETDAYCGGRGVQGDGNRSDPHADPFLMPSKAQNMVDEMRQAVASLPRHMDAMCRAIAAKGGPKVPPGVHTHLHSHG